MPNSTGNPNVWRNFGAQSW